MNLLKKYLEKKAAAPNTFQQNWNQYGGMQLKNQPGLQQQQQQQQQMAQQQDIARRKATGQFGSWPTSPTSWGQGPVGTNEGPYQPRTFWNAPDRRQQEKQRMDAERANAAQQRVQANAARMQRNRQLASQYRHPDAWKTQWQRGLSPAQRSMVAAQADVRTAHDPRLVGEALAKMNPQQVAQLRDIPGMPSNWSYGTAPAAPAAPTSVAQAPKPVGRAITPYIRPSQAASPLTTAMLPQKYQTQLASYLAKNPERAKYIQEGLRGIRTNLRPAELGAVKRLMQYKNFRPEHVAQLVKGKSGKV